jgi:hypothetical protein
MQTIQRHSPVQFGSPRITETQSNWTIALSYDDEGLGPFLVDLCHKIRWDIQDKGLDATSPLDFEFPGVPGSCILKNGVLTSRMNRTQAAIWHLGTATPELPTEMGYTDVTESTVFLALFGPRIFSIAEKLTSLDFLDPVKAAPFLLQGPLSHVPCQIVTLEKNSDGSGGLLLTCSRGYGHSMVHAIRDAGSEFGLRPAGENRFSAWLKGLAG